MGQLKSNKEMTEQEDKEIRSINSLLKGKEDKRNGTIFCVGEVLDLPEGEEKRFALWKLLPIKVEQDNKIMIQYYRKEVIVQCETTDKLRENVERLIRLYLS